MKIAVCGSNRSLDKETAKKAFEIGKEITGKNVLLLTGAGNGYPYEAAKGAFSVNGKVFGVSPAKNDEEHVNAYNFPNDAFTKIEFTGLGIPGRNYPLVKEADAIIIISGQAGSLNEFTIAFHYDKVIGILENSGGIVRIIKEIAEICDKRGESKNIIYSSEPKELVQLVINKLNQ
jgi:hypothetical protein|tara:strand:+ start:1816 stop:2343 length:528 start_codon:yes stop_codon:yes gene_type:complete